MAAPVSVFLLAPLLLVILLPHAAKSLYMDDDVEQERMTTRKPFRIFWNVPYHTCVVNSPHADLNAKLESYGIEAYYNEERETEGVHIFYSALLKWPYIKHGTWYNGGLPQHADVESHLSALRQRIIRRTLSSYTGLGVLNMEKFRPVLFANYGGLKFLRDIQLKETARVYNITSKSQLQKKAIETFETGARVIMEASLEEAIKQRPDMKWGYYGYPQHSMIGRWNDHIPWLWNITTAFYPSLYIYDRNSPNLEKTQQETISETYRVRAKYGDPSVPIYAYQVVEDGEGYFYNETLDQVVDATIKKGVDGIVIWGSSSIFHPSWSLGCKKLLSYVHDYLGPRILTLRKQMADCSNQLCWGRGRCVSQFYVGKIEHILDRGFPQPDIPLTKDKRPDREKTRKEFLDNYACQCYKNWTGRWCRLSR